MDTNSHQQQEEREEQEERERFIAALREGLEDLKHGRGRAAEEVYAELREKYDF